MSWRDNSSSSNRSSTNDGNGGDRDAGGNVHGTGSGSGLGGRGGLTGQRFGNLGRGLPKGGRMAPEFRVTPVAAPPLAPMVAPPMPPVSGPPNRVDLNPATLAPWNSVQPVRMDPGILGQMLGGFNRPQSTFPARPGAGGVGFGNTFRNGFAGHAGGGQGGGGGGGW